MDLTDSIQNATDFFLVTELSTQVTFKDLHLKGYLMLKSRFLPGNHSPSQQLSYKIPLLSVTHSAIDIK